LAVRHADVLAKECAEVLERGAAAIEGNALERRVGLPYQVFCDLQAGLVGFPLITRAELAQPPLERAWREADFAPERLQRARRVPSQILVHG